jgi:hypothetical protein
MKTFTLIMSLSSILGYSSRFYTLEPFICPFRNFPMAIIKGKRALGQKKVYGGVNLKNDHYLVKIACK